MSVIEILHIYIQIIVHNGCYRNLIASMGKWLSSVPVQSAAQVRRKIRVPGPRKYFLNRSRLHLQFATALQTDLNVHIQFPKRSVSTNINDIAECLRYARLCRVTAGMSAKVMEIEGSFVVGQARNFRGGGVGRVAPDYFSTNHLLYSLLYLLLHLASMNIRVDLESGLHITRVI